MHLYYQDSLPWFKIDLAIWMERVMTNTRKVARIATFVLRKKGERMRALSKMPSGMSLPLGGGLCPEGLGRAELDSPVNHHREASEHWEILRMR